MDIKTLCNRIAALVASSGTRGAAAHLGVDPGEVSRVVNGLRLPSQRMLKGLGYRKVTHYIPVYKRKRSKLSDER